MNVSDFHALRQRIGALRKQSTIRDGKEIPMSIVALEEELAKEQDAASRYDLYQLMRSEYFEAGILHMEVETMRACVRDLPEEPLPWISLADALRRDPKCKAEAKNVAAIAVDKAYKADRFVRHALSMQARIAAETHDANVLTSAVTRLVEDAPSKRQEDGPFDLDFMASLPENMIDDSLAQRYIAVAQASRKSSG